MKEPPNLIPELEIACKSLDNAIEMSKFLLQEGYAVLLTSEENLTIINAIWTYEEWAERNNVVFMPRDEFDSYFVTLDELSDDDEDEVELDEDEDDDEQLSLFN